MHVESMSSNGGGSEGDFHLFSNDTQSNGGCLAMDTQRHIYVDDLGNYRIEKFEADGKFIGRWGSKGDGDGQFSDTTCVAVDSQNNV